MAIRFLQKKTSVSKTTSGATVKAILLHLGALLAALTLATYARAQTAADPSTIEPPLPAAATPMSFARACEQGSSITIAAVGDVLPQEGLAEQSYASSIGFESLWHKLVPYISGADMAYANLEGAVAPGVAGGGRLVPDPGPTLNRLVYTGTAFMFNYNPRIVGDLKRSGFDILSIANNHALDRTSIGVDKTIEAMRDYQMAFSGGHPMTEPNVPISTVVERNGFRVAWIACTDVYNGPDPKHLITACADEGKIIAEISRLKADTSIDAVIIAPHWGEEYHHIATQRQRAKARRFLDAGASAVIGSHPHMLEEVESYRTQDGRDTAIAYSLGNFVSGQGSRPGLKITVLLFVGLTKRPGEKAWVNGVSALPLWMDRGPHSINVAEVSKQAPKATVMNIVSRLIDPSRLLRANAPVKTNIGCP